ncbi:phosphate transporter [Ochromonadaceae sp. CCMP2298]|nr:phosphate transporter [Ochromonadaceae sp. CCMP2298]
MFFDPTAKFFKSVARGLAVLLLVAAFSDPSMAIVYDNTKDFTWLVVFAGIIAFLASCGIGANDVANAFATSVGAKSVTIFQAVCIASVFEFLGAVLLGSQVVKTISKGIADTDCFADNPGLLMYGMTVVIMTTGLWLAIASYYEMPVSTTHSTIGGIIGMTMMTRGSECVLWSEHADEFPYLNGVSAIVVSWAVSPVASACIAAALYGMTYLLVLKDKENSFYRATWAFPIIVGFTVSINAGMFILKGAKGKAEEMGTDDIINNAKDGDGHKLAIVLLISGAVSFAVTMMLTPFLVKRCEEAVQAEAAKSVTGLEANEAGTIKAIKSEDAREAKETQEDDWMTIWMTKNLPTVLKDAVDYVRYQVNRDPHDILKEDHNQDKITEMQDVTVGIKAVVDMHNQCERHDPRTEELFKYVQVFTAIVDSFSHGANDVANAMGPFAAVYVMYRDNTVVSSKDIGGDMYWILAIGGLGIVLGLSTYGYKIMTALGVKLVTVTPSRGYCIELGAAFVVMFGSTQGWPLSTTHCQVGATVGVGLFEGTGGVNPRTLGMAVLGCLATLVVCGMTAALIVGPNPEGSPSAYGSS